MHVIREGLHLIAAACHSRGFTFSASINALTIVVLMTIYNCIALFEAPPPPPPPLRYTYKNTFKQQHLTSNIFFLSII